MKLFPTKEDQQKEFLEQLSQEKEYEQNHVVNVILELKNKPIDNHVVHDTEIIEATREDGVKHFIHFRNNLFRVSRLQYARKSLIKEIELITGKHVKIVTNFETNN